MSQSVGLDPKRIIPTSSTSTGGAQASPTQETKDNSSTLAHVKEQKEHEDQATEREKSLRRLKRRADAEAPIDREILKSKNPILMIHEAAQQVSEFGKANLKGAKEHIKEAEKVTAAVSKEKALKHEEGAGKFQSISGWAKRVGGISLLLTFFQDVVAKKLAAKNLPYVSTLIPNQIAEYMSNIPGEQWSGIVTKYGDTLLQSWQQQANQDIQSKTQFSDHLYQLYNALEREARERQSTEERTDQEHTQTLAREGVRAATQILTGGRV